jgi:hypothetical protein
MEVECLNNIDFSIKIRSITTVFVFAILLNNNIATNKHLFFILALLLYLLDEVDSFLVKAQYFGRENTCNKNKLFRYQIQDKIVDLLSYYYVYLLFPEDKNILYLCFYRTAGVVLFYKTLESKWLILFFDFIKEYMLYRFFFNKNFTYLPYFVVVKIFIEYIIHHRINKPNYN